MVPPTKIDPADEESWPITAATVISSQYQYAKSHHSEADFGSDNSYFLVTFKYEVNEEYFLDSFEAQTDYDEGHHFEIAYDPSSPQINTYGTPKESKTSRVVTFFVGIALAVIIIYLSEKFEWNEYRH